jgi:hypothetical protein
MPGKRSAIYGALTDSRGRSRNVEVFQPKVLGVNEKAGFAPERLDDVVASLIENAEGGAELLKQYTPMLQQLMMKLGEEIKLLLEHMAPTTFSTNGEAAPTRITDALTVALELSSKVSVVLERVNKMVMQSSKSVDDVTRLRTFLVTGDDDPTGIDGLGETDLRRIVANAASGFKESDNWTKPQEAE